MEPIPEVVFYAVALIAGLWGFAWREQRIKRRAKDVQGGLLARYGVVLTDEFCASFSRKHEAGGPRGKVLQGETMAELPDGVLTTVLVRGREKPSVYRKNAGDWVPLPELDKVKSV